MVLFAGTLTELRTVSNIEDIDINAELDDEIDTLNNYADIEEAEDVALSQGEHYLGLKDVDLADTTFRPDFASMAKEASEEVIVKSTRSEYERHWKQFTYFCSSPSVQFIEHPQDIEKMLPDLPADLPMWIVTWIMDKADEKDIYTGKVKSPDTPRATYNAAQKMRAAISHKFGRDFGFSARLWQENATHPETFTGNPSLSPLVCQYMISLRRRKAQAGEIVTSARAIDVETMKKLYIFNMSFPSDILVPVRREADRIHWGGTRIRLMLQTIYIIALLCLLRFDEALSLTWDDVHFEKWENGHRVRLELRVRKTHQYGGIAPFYLYPNRDRPWLCPVHLLARWWQATVEMGVDLREKGSYVFRKRVGKDRVCADANACMSSESFLTCFRNNLCDIGVDPRMYGTHSFRRGGCQYLAMELRWPLRHICTWGGWAENFDSPGTIFKYLLSHVDTPMLDRADYMNPHRQAAAPCPDCGRTCYCA